MNSHGIADFAHELQAVCADQLPACILSQTGLAVPVPPGLVLPAFSTEGYVRETDTLVYVEQDAQSVTLTGADGTFWLALATDTWTAYAQWTTEAGTHYRWRPNATQPADVAGLLTFASVTVAGGAVTAVSPLPTVTRAAAGRALLGLGTLATQNANAVAITGGSLTELERLWTIIGPTTPKVVAQDVAGGGPGSGLVGYVTAGTNRYNLNCPGSAQNYLAGPLGLGEVAPATNFRLHVAVDKTAAYGAKFRHVGGDTGGAQPVMFENTAGTVIGSISTDATTTAFNTTSDVRLKESIEPLTGALSIIQALKPIAYLWKADGSPGVGFRADEVQQVVDGVVTGTPDALNEDGTIAPLQIDHSKLVPWLTAALQETLAQVQALTVRVALLEGQA